MALMSGDGWLFLLRWIHFLAGITWIGLLYYFNFVQTPFFAETEAAGADGRDPEAGSAGPLVVPLGRHDHVPLRLALPPPPEIGQGGFFAAPTAGRSCSAASSAPLMWANVWFVIWPNQKIVIQNAIDTAAGKPANPAAAPAGRPRRPGLPDQHDAFHPDALLHGRGEPPRAGGAPVGVVFWIVALADHAGGRVQRAQGRPGQGRGQAARHRVRHAVGGLHPPGGLLHLFEFDDADRALGRADAEPRSPPGGAAGLRVSAGSVTADRRRGQARSAPGLGAAASPWSAAWAV